MSIRKALEEKERFLPDAGYHLVGVDDFEPPGEALYFISAHATAEEAIAAKKARLAENPGEIVHVYGPPEDRTPEERLSRGRPTRS